MSTENAIALLIFLSLAALLLMSGLLLIVTSRRKTDNDPLGRIQNGTEIYSSRSGLLYTVISIDRSDTTVRVDISNMRGHVHRNKKMGLYELLNIMSDEFTTVTKREESSWS